MKHPAALQNARERYSSRRKEILKKLLRISSWRLTYRSRSHARVIIKWFIFTKLNTLLQKQPFKMERIILNSRHENHISLFYRTRWASRTLTSRSGSKWPPSASDPNWTRTTTSSYFFWPVNSVGFRLNDFLCVHFTLLLLYNVHCNVQWHK